MKLRGIGRVISTKNKIESILFGGNRPDFVIVGAQKSGTSSLYHYLNELDGFIGSNPKEVHYFDREDNYAKGNKWYENHYIKLPWEKGLFFEATPEYLCRKKVPGRLKTYKPDLKIIILLREPISRAYSAWNMYRQWSEDGYIPWGILNDQYGRDESPLFRVFFKNGCPSFSDYIKLELDLILKNDDAEEPRLLRRGIYKPQIEKYVNNFGRSNVLIIGFNELCSDSDAVIQKCYDFLGMECLNTIGCVEREVKNKRIYPSKIKAEDLHYLEEFYERPNQELFRYLGFAPDW
jgi:hypothetical protein